jgi:hypothetical protein
MGATASGAPTPDAAVLSGARLPDLATPVPASVTATVMTRQIKRSAVQKAGARALWVQMENLSNRIDASLRVETLTDAKGAELRGHLDGLRDKYGLHQRTDELRLSPMQRRQARTEVGALDHKIDALLLAHSAKGRSTHDGGTR